MTIKKCSPNRLIKLKKLGIDTDGSYDSMEKIIINKGFGLPGEHIEEITEWVTLLNKKGEPYDEFQSIPTYYYGFNLTHVKTYTLLTFTYADALAEELILLKILKLI